MGLTAAEVKTRREKFGANEIRREKGRSAWLLLASQFKNPLVIILVFACVVSGVLGETLEAVAIALILALNAVIGFFQEYRAETAIAALQRMTAPRAKVIRNGHQVQILASEIVPDDILVLEAGDIVAADAELIEASHLQINEALLTGESLPVTKETGGATEGTLAERFGSVLMGTFVATGTATCKVTQTGMRTELGKIAHLIATAKSEPTPLQIQIDRVGKSLLLICLIIAAVVGTIGFIQGTQWLEILIFSVSLAVAAVPEGLPAIVTVALALGVQRMAARNALVRKLPSVETLGCVSVICTDKTGTLTTGSMRVRELWGEDHRELLRVAASCCDADVDEDSDDGVGDPTEIAILIAARERKIERKEIENETPRISTEPFDSDRKRMSILREDGFNYVKGAVESVAPLCSSNPHDASRAIAIASEMASRGLRTLAIAVGQGAGESNLKLVGILGLADPPRTEAIQALRETRSAGIKTIMITGDHPQTAVAIARELGLLIDGEDSKSLVHARATPEDKLQLVRSWKSQGAIVAMTGDGVNDAPALREANIGIAMGKSGTEVTRQAADLILADDNFATIAVAVQEGRAIFQNIRKAITYLLTGNFAEITVVLGAMMLRLPPPLAAAHLLWINLVTDALPALTLVADPLSPDLMKRKPRPPNEQILGKAEWLEILLIGLLEAAVALGLYWYFLSEKDAAYARNIVFPTMVFSQIFRAFGARSRSRIFWAVGVFSNVWLLGVAIVSGFIQLSLHDIPVAKSVFGLQSLAFSELKIIFAFALVPITVIECRKLIKYKLRRLPKDQ